MERGNKERGKEGRRQRRGEKKVKLRKRDVEAIERKDGKREKKLKRKSDRRNEEETERKGKEGRGQK